MLSPTTTELIPPPPSRVQLAHRQLASSGGFQSGSDPPCRKVSQCLALLVERHDDRLELAVVAVECRLQVGGGHTFPVTLSLFVLLKNRRGREVDPNPRLQNSTCRVSHATSTSCLYTLCAYLVEPCNALLHGSEYGHVPHGLHRLATSSFLVLAPSSRESSPEPSPDKLPGAKSSCIHSVGGGKPAAKTAKKTQRN